MHLFVVFTLAVISVIFFGFNLYYLWYLGDALINVGFSDPNIAKYLGHLLQNGAILLVVALILNVIHELE